MNSTLVSKTYAGLDVWKFVMAFAVITIHSRTEKYAFGVYPDYISWFISLAVPFFFIVSGFLLAQKLHKLNSINEKKNLLLSRSKQMFKLFASWLMVYFPIYIYCAITNDKPWYKDIVIYFQKVIFFGESDFAWPLWYIYSMAIVCYLLYLFFYKSNKSRIVLAVTFFSAALAVSLGILPQMPHIGVPNSLCDRVLGGAI